MTKSDQLMSLRCINAVRRQTIATGSMCPDPLHDLVVCVRATSDLPLAALVRRLLVALGAQTRDARDSERFHRGDHAMSLLATLVDEWLADRYAAGRIHAATSGNGAASATS